MLLCASCGMPGKKHILTKAEPPPAIVDTGFEGQDDLLVSCDQFDTPTSHLLEEVRHIVFAHVKAVEA